MIDVDKVLERHGLKRLTARKYVANIIQFNQQDAAEAMGMSWPTVSRYKQAFREMGEEERARVLAVVSRELYDAAVEVREEWMDESERSENGGGDE